MSRTYANQYFSTTLYYTYYCSKCGIKNHKKKIIKTTGSASKMGVFHSKSVKENLMQEAHDNGAYAHTRIIRRIFDEAQNGKFRTAELRARCTLCRHQEPWSKFHFAWIDKVFLSAFPILLLFTLICLMGKEFLNALLLFAIPITLYSMLSFYKKIRIKTIERKIDELPKNALPVFSFKDDDFYK